MIEMRKYAAGLIGLYLLCYLLPLGARDLIIPDETRYAEIPREMISSGDWIAPHLNGLRYFEKPVLGYWVHAAALLVFGENEFAVRFPSALAAGLTALLIFGLVSRALRPKEGLRPEEREDNGEALLSPLVFLSCFGVVGISNMAVLDNLFSFLLSACMVSFYLASEERPGSRKEILYLFLSGIFCGLAFLTKGFLAVVLPALALSPYLVWQRRYRDLWRMGWLPVLVAVLVSLPWSIAVHLKEPDFWHFFFWNEHIRRFMADNAQHHEPFWYFLLAGPGMMMPWIFVTPAAAGGIRKGIADPTSRGRLIRFAICWLSLPFLFFSASNGKLLTYILPCFPPVAVLMAVGLSGRGDDGTKRVFNRGLIGAGILFGVVLLALIFVQIFGYKGMYLYSRPWKSLMAANSLIFFILFCFWAGKCQKNRDQILLFSLAPLLIFFSSHFILPDQTIEQKMPGIFLTSHLRDIGPETVIICDTHLIRAACWYFKRDDVVMLGGRDELGYGLSQKEAAGRLLYPKEAARLIDRRRGNVVLIARAKHMDRWRNELPAPVHEDNSGPNGYYFFRY
ncbi:MAG: phospholipid carrier-dependent glycosyltransferase [Pseudomonadota bacterium]